MSLKGSVAKKRLHAVCTAKHGYRSLSVTREIPVMGICAMTEKILGGEPPLGMCPSTRTPRSVAQIRSHSVAHVWRQPRDWRRPDDACLISNATFLQFIFIFIFNF